ncbi:hypothetical protein Purlil1_8539 [Purpureocillium lilacinum]|uniref:NACHT domain-containing protein n=1 Tax=Purpureocillium lilacinum TaxID=33203 RepID=A0ABR0BSN7_PURLI|nr:hypothetical protein Purlil1_8539 [Purpureocillium lilacinum]
MDVAQALRVSGDDLWAAAIRTLGDKLRSQIDFAQESKQKTLDELLAVTEQARKRLVDKSWSFKRKNGEVVFVRDVLAKAAKWVNHFKDVGDIAVQYDPVHAALPWAGVRFLLNVAVGDLNTYTSLLEGTVDIAEMICRNALVESLLKASRSQSVEELSRALVKLYANVLTYLAQARAYYGQNSIKRVVKHGVLASSDLESAFATISEAQKDVDRCTTVFGLQEQLQSHAELKQMLKDFDAPVSRWDKALHAITDQLHAQKRGEILRWISAEPYRQHHEQAKSEVLEGTGKWLLQNRTFLRWKNESASSILWLRGIPGSGKSKLTSIVIENAQDAFQRSQSPAPVYFYCSRNPAEPGRSDPSKVVASIARQLSTPQPGGSLLQAAVEAYMQREADAFASGPLRLVESKDLILKLLQRYEDATVTLVIDALDECNDKKRDLLGVLEGLLKASPCLLKIFVSSRTDQDIVYRLINYPNLDVSSECNSADIDLFVRSETKHLIEEGSLLWLSTRKEELRDKIIHELSSGARGMFRWASLQLAALRQLTTDDAILERLGRLPKTLAGLYQEILAKIEKLDADADRQFAQNALSWLLCARRQLPSNVFLAAVSVKEDGSASAISKDQLLQLCCNLVIFDSAADAFRFSHLSVREFLEAQEMYKPASANALVAEACLSNLVRMTPEASPRTLFRTYSCLFWAEHTRAAAQETQTRLNKILRKFLAVEQDQTCFYHWHRSVEELSDDPTVRWKVPLKLQAAMSHTPSVLLVVCAYDLTGVLDPGQWRQLARKGPRNKGVGTHQEVAVRYGSVDIIEWHFNNGIHFEVTEEIVKAAAGNEESGEKVMAVLLDKCEAKIQITEGVAEAAARNSESGKEILALLLDKCGPEIQMTEGFVKTVIRNFDQTIFLQLFDKRGAEIQITEGVVRTAAGNSRSGQEIVALLLDKRGPEIQITEEVVEAAAGNYGSGKEILALLLDKRGAEIQITEGVVRTAAGNSRSGKEIVALLLDKCGPEIQITEGVVKTAARNWGSGKEILALLLNKRGAEIQITEEVIKAAAGNRRSGQEILALLLDKCGADIQITEEVVEAASRNWGSGKEILALLLDKRGPEIQITEEVVEVVARNMVGGPEIVALLLDKCGPEIQMRERVVKAIVGSFDLTIFRQLFDKRGAEIQITEGVIKAAAGNWRSGKKILELLLDKRGPEIQITEEIIKAAAMNSESGKEILALLLDKCGTEIQITEEVIKAAAGNWRSGKKILALLLDKRGADIHITEEVVEAAAGNLESGKKIVALLLDKRGPEIQVTERVIKAAAGNGESGEKVMAVLLEKRGADIQITEEVVEAAARNWRSGKEIMALLLDKCGSEIQVTEGVIKAAAGNWRRGREILALLLDKRGTEIQITEGVIKAAARNSESGKEILALLLDKRGTEIQITEEMVEAAARNRRSGKEIMALLLDKCSPEIQIAEGVVKTVVGSFDLTIFRQLFDKRGAEIQITEGVIKAAAGNWRSDKKILALLLDKCGTEIQITEEIIKAAAMNSESGKEILALLLDKRGAEIQITEGVVRTAAGNSRSGQEIVALLLDKCGPEIQITEEVVKAAARNWRSGKEILALLLDKCGSEIQVTEGVIKAAAGNWRRGKKILALLLDKRGTEIQITEGVVKAVVRSVDLTIFRHLFDKRGAEIQITEGVIKAAARNSESGKEILALLLDKRGAEIQITEGVIKAAAMNSESGKEILALLLDKRGTEIQITEEVVKAAAGNWRSGKKILALFLDKRGPEVQITEEVVKAAAETGACARIVGLLMNTRKSDTIAAITDRVCFAAASCGQLDSLHYLCQHIPPANVDPSWDSIARFYQAAQSGDVDRVNQLLRKPIPFDTKNSKGQTPLWIAAFNRQTDVVSILVRGMHVNVNSLSAPGQSPIFWPSAYGYEDVVNILVSAGAKSHFVDADGRTAVSMARQNGHENIVRILDPQSIQHRETELVGRKLWWRQLSLCIGLALLGLIFSTFCT